MMKSSKNNVLFFLLIMILTLLSGCSCKTAAKNQKLVLNEVAHSIFYAPMYVAIENGYFKEEGIDLELVTGFGADKTMTAVLTDEADIGFMGSEASIYTYLQGAADYPVNFAQLTQRAGNFLVARTQNDTFSWEDLKGANVLGGRKGGMPEMVFEYILKNHGIDPDTDLQIDTSIAFGSTAAAFSGANPQDKNYPVYTVEFEPHATLLEKQGVGYIVASLGEDSGYVPYTAFCAKKSYIDEHPEQILAFTKAIQKGLEYVNANSADSIANVIKPQFKETEFETITTIVERYKNQDTWKNDTVFEEESFLLLENILMDAGELEAYVPYEELVTTDFSKKAASK